MNTVSGLRAKLAERETKRSSISLLARDLYLDEHARLCVNGAVFELTSEGRTALARRTSIPCDFFEKCPSAVQSSLFNQLHELATARSKREEMVTLVIEDKTHVIGILNGALALLSSLEVLDLAVAECPSPVKPDSLEVSSAKVNGHLRVSITTPNICTEPRVGDVVFGGIDILHSDTAAFGTCISSYLMRLACRNGMLVKTCAHDENATRRIRRANAPNRDVTCARITEMAHRAWYELDAKIQAIQDLTQQPITDIEKLIESIGEKYRFPARLVQEIMTASSDDEIDPSSSLWDLVNALSRVGTHSQSMSEARQRYLQELSGELINERVPQCPTCGRVLPRRMRFLPRH